MIWLQEALHDAERLRDFLKDKNPKAAANMGKILKRSAKLLTDFPEIGSPMEDETKRRELFIPFGAGCYVLRYIIYRESVVIIRVWHSKEHRK